MADTFTPQPGVNYISNIKDQQPIFGGGAGYTVAPASNTPTGAVYQNGVFQGTSPIQQGSSPTPTPTPAPSGGGGGSNQDPHINPQGVWDDNWFASHQNVNDIQNQQRGAINSGYDAYFNQLNDILNNGLPQQQAAQNTIANSQYDQGVNQLGTQRDLGLQDLGTQRQNADTQQAKTLQDLHNNIQSLFQSGNVYLGAKGAADSSAANQYSYALTKMGSKQQGDLTSQYAQIQNDINGRESRLNEIYSGQVQNLASQRDQQVSQIAQWFAQQQNALKQAQAQGQLQKGQDLASLSQNYLNYALSQLQTVQQQAAQQKSQLDQWAMNHSNDINQLKQNLSQVSTTNYQMSQAQALAGQPNVGGGGGSPSLFGFGANQDNKTNNFGQPIA